MPVLKALKAFRYDKTKLSPGDLFKCKERHIPVLTHAGLATKPEVEIAQPVPVYQTRHMEAQKQKTVAELRAEAEAKGISLPKGYVSRSKLMNLVGDK